MEGLDFERQELRKSMCFTEVDYSGVNPRTFYRHLVRKIEEIREDGRFKYDVDANQNEDFKIEEESIGTATGRLEARVKAEQKTHEVIAHFPVRYRSSLLWAVVFGVLTFLVGRSGVQNIAGGDAMLGSGLLVVAGLAGYKGYESYRKRVDPRPALRRATGAYTRRSYGTKRRSSGRNPDRRVRKYEYGIHR